MALAAGWMFFRAELRRRWRAWLALALIVGAFAGTVEAAAAGARRTDAAYPSLLAWSDAPDLLMFSFSGASQTFGRFSPQAAEAVPQARQAAILAGIPRGVTGRGAGHRAGEHHGSRPVLAPPDPVRPPA